MNVLAICGVLGPLLFWSAVLGAASLRPDYSHVSDSISDLGTGPNAELINAAFLAYGALTAIFALGLRRALPREAWRGAELLAVSGAGIALLGVEWFVGVMPPLFRPLHNALAITAYVTGTAACFATAEGLRGDQRWAGVAAFSRACGIFGAGLIGASVLASLGAPQVLATLASGDPSVAPISGALQRLLTADLQLWVAVLAMRLLTARERRPADALA